jgi:hypothetical protein
MGETRGRRDEKGERGAETPESSGPLQLEPPPSPLVPFNLNHRLESTGPLPVLHWQWNWQFPRALLWLCCCAKLPLMADADLAGLGGAMQIEPEIATAAV